MNRGVYNILKANFLVNRDAVENWKFIVFCTALAIIMIASSHSAERKVHQISRLNEEVRELRSEFVDRRSALMQLKMESTLIQKLKLSGIQPSDNPPYKIKVNLSE